VFLFVRIGDVTPRRAHLAAPVLAWVLFVLVLALAAVSLPLAAARLKDAVDLDAVREGPAGVVHRALEPAHVSLWLSDRG